MYVSHESLQWRTIPRRSEVMSDYTGASVGAMPVMVRQAPAWQL